jgi:hypothetical protein
MRFDLKNKINPQFAVLIGCVIIVTYFDLWEAGQYPSLCALGIMMVAILVVLAFVANKVGAKIGIKREG